MTNQVNACLQLLLERYPVLHAVEAEIIKSFEIIRSCYENGGKLLICGNGGSCADAEHIVGELMKGFKLPRNLDQQMREKLEAVDPEMGAALGKCLQGGLPAVALSSHPGLNTAFMNDVNGEMIYAQQVNALGMPRDVLIGISTSGNAKNVMYAAVTARAKGMQVIGLTGKDGGKLNAMADVNIVVPCNETYQIQELHLPVYHALCLMLEEHFFG